MESQTPCRIFSIFESHIKQLDFSGRKKFKKLSYIIIKKAPLTPKAELRNVEKLLLAQGRLHDCKTD